MWHLFQLAHTSHGVHDAGHIVTFTSHGGTIKNLRTGTTTQFGRECGLCVDHVGMKRAARRNVFFRRQERQTSLTRATVEDSTVGAKPSGRVSSVWWVILP